MKKTLIMATGALMALVACTKTELTPTADREISFQVADYVSQTKAAGDATAFPSDSTFGTYAYLDSKNNGALQQVFMKNEKISYVSASSLWKPSKPYYWPKQGDVDFVSYSPYSATTPWIEFKGNGTDSATVFKGTITNCTGKEDFMYSDKAVDYTDNDEIYYTDGVPTLFHHALAQITVHVKTDTVQNASTKWEINVLDFKISNIAKKGTVEFSLNSYTPGTGQEVGWTAPASGFWTIANDDYTGTINASIPSSVNPLTKVGAPILTNYTVVPQQLAIMGRQIAEITYEIKTYHVEDGVPESTPYTTEKVYDRFSLTVGGITQWKINTSVTYYLTISPNTKEITLDPAVTTWINVNVN